VFRVGAELGAERAAHVRGDDPHAGLVEAEHGGQRVAGALRALVGDPGGQPAILAPLGRSRPGLHRRGRDPLVHDGPLDHHLAPFEQVVLERGRVPERRGHVAAHLGEQHGGIGLAGLSRVDDDRQRLVIRVHQFGRVLTLVGLLGDHHRDRLANEPDHVAGQQRLAHLAVDHLRHRRGEQREIGQVGAGVCGDHAGGGPGGGQVDRPDPGVRDG
jgi:hypothetical protein